MKNCAHCRAKFGLIRHRYGLQQFCSKKCLAAFKLKLEGRFDKDKVGTNSSPDRVEEKSMPTCSTTALA